MSKVFMGVRLQRVREERGLTQAALAKLLGISPSYLNQIERNQRPLTVPVLLRIGAALEVDPQVFSEHGSAALLTDVRDAFGELPGTPPASMAELKMLVENMPAVARAVLQMQERYQRVVERAEALEAQCDPGDRELRANTPASDDEVREYLNRQQNYIDALDQAAELVGDTSSSALQQRLWQRHRVTVMAAAPEDILLRKRHYDAQQKVLWLPESMSSGQRAFQMAAQTGLLEQGELIETLIREAAFSGADSAANARLALSNYFAGAALMPYQRFLAAAEAQAYDIEQLAHQFGTGFEAVCHRLSTMQRPGHAGLPVFFVRVDRAGNVSKRQSATAFHFSRVGGTCPLWIVYEAFSHPGRVLRQVARMPDGSTYLWIARQVSTGPFGFNAPKKSFAVALGCDISQAHRLVYAKGLDVRDPAMATLIGSGCKVCERSDCPQRAFPALIRTAQASSAPAA